MFASHAELGILSIKQTHVSNVFPSLVLILIAQDSIKWNWICLRFD